MRAHALILLVEDREDDVLLMLKAFEHAGIKNPVEVANNGEQALEYLAPQGPYSHHAICPVPELVLLDLKLPGMDGFEVLQWIRAQPHLAGLRVVVLTSSDNIRDVNSAYALGANSFLVKPTEFSRFAELGRCISDNWLQWSRPPELPNQPTAGSSPRDTTAKKVFLRDRASRRFYASRSAWVNDKHNALDFERIELAEAVATAEHLHQVEIVLAFDEPPCELSLPLASPGVRRA